MFSCGLIGLLLLCLHMVLPLDARATMQEHDGIRYEGKDLIILECPLNCIRNSKDMLDFDVISTANRKGYTASWKITRSRLFLTSFSAKIAGKSVTIENLIPGRSLPVFADWYTGQVRIPIPETTQTANENSFRETWTLIILDIERGHVTKTSVQRSVPFPLR